MTSSKLTFVLTLAFCLSGCSSFKYFDSSAPSGLPVGKSNWSIGSVWGKDVLERAPITVAFDGVQTVSGDSGCNRYEGKYTLTGRRMTISDLQTITNRTCDEQAVKQESRLFRALSATRWVRPKDSSAVTLRSGWRRAGVPLLLKQKDDRAS